MTGSAEGVIVCTTFVVGMEAVGFPTMMGGFAPECVFLLANTEDRTASQPLAERWEDTL
jgi:hypothetical protein